MYLSSEGRRGGVPVLLMLISASLEIDWVVYCNFNLFWIHLFINSDML